METWNGAKAIETNYGAHRFRSRLEARYAVFFDTLEVEWLYEVEGFELEGLRYLPDFFLPKHDLFLEVKPVGPTEKEIEKGKRLHRATVRPVCFAVGDPPGDTRIAVIATDSAESSGGECWWEPVIWYYCRRCDTYDLSYGDDHCTIVNAQTWKSCKLCECPVAERVTIDPLLLAAWVRAKHERFDRR